MLNNGEYDGLFLLGVTSRLPELARGVCICINIWGGKFDWYNTREVLDKVDCPIMSNIYYSMFTKYNRKEYSVDDWSNILSHAVERVTNYYTLYELCQYVTDEICKLHALEVIQGGR